ncbi:hypothetical protein C8R44DRAFT_874268 [Mycena epipterygia]|nr:hypothetical protein C8R44DRAFT_874268 [Mycena epipterygia]
MFRAVMVEALPRLSLDTPSLVSWVVHTAYFSSRLEDISLALVMKSPFYGPNPWSSQMGDMPEVVKEDSLTGTHYQKKDAQKVAANARRTILSQLGFLSWFQTIKPSWREDLDAEDLAFIKRLRLSERKKRGFLFDLSRDYHEINF